MLEKFNPSLRNDVEIERIHLRLADGTNEILEDVRAFAIFDKSFVVWGASNEVVRMEKRENIEWLSIVERKAA